LKSPVDPKDYLNIPVNLRSFLNINDPYIKVTIIRCLNDSMNGVGIIKGNLLIFNSHPVITPRNNDIVLAKINESLVCRRLKLALNLLVPENPGYDAYSLESASILGVLKWLINTEFPESRELT
jgi:SOS-response transcriptional repressor LexA